MKKLESIQALRQELSARRAAGETIEFVPTMGAFHDGHLGLMRRAHERGGCVVVSIFLNPLQFDSSNDFASYPRDLEGDLAAAEQAGVDVAFAPSVEEMYPSGELQTRVHVGRIAEVIEGRFRPGHFSGVATVCSKLFNIVQPDRVYLGQKDAQQVAVIRQMVSDLNIPVELVVCPTSREDDGLARSSRNQLLSPADRSAAALLFRALEMASSLLAEGKSVDEAVAAASDLIRRRPELDLQYLDVVDSDTFERVENISGQATIVVAARVGPVRLIDNVVVGTGPPA